MRKSDPFLFGVAAGSALLLLSAMDATLRARASAPAIAERAALVAALELTDLALFTEARYTRHPSQADLHSAFQDHPLALDHFPSASLVPTPVPPMAATMSQWLRRQRYLIDFTLASLWRRKTKNLGLLLVYALIVFLLASVMLFSQALRREAGWCCWRGPRPSPCNGCWRAVTT